MPLEVFAVVLAAAVFHALWNLLVKSNGDRLVVMATLCASAGVLAVALTPLVAVPAVASWPYLFASLVLHVGYMLFLLLAYRYGELSHVYPLARGSAPLIVAAVSVAVVGEALTPQGWLAVALVALGIMSLTLTRGAAGMHDPRPVLAALVTGGFIASYTVVDAIGGRLSGSAPGYAVWLFVVDGVPLPLLALALRRRAFLAAVRQRWLVGSIGGALAFAGYGLVIWALSVAPMALVAALRETSIVLAVLFGVVFLRERFDVVRWLGTAATLCGTVLLKLAR